MEQILARLITYSGLTILVLMFIYYYVYEIQGDYIKEQYFNIMLFIGIIAFMLGASSVVILLISILN
jgi:hypothetical protein